MGLFDGNCCGCALREMRNISTPHCRHLSSTWQSEAQRGIVNIWKVRENVEIFQRITSLQFWWVLHHTKTIDNRSKMEKFFKTPIKLSFHLKSLKGVGSKVNPFNPLSLSVLSVTRAPRVLVAACVISDTVSRHEERHCSHGPIHLQPAAAI